MVDVIDRIPSDFRFVYEDDAPLWDKMKAIATKIYGAADITADAKVRAQIEKLQEDGYRPLSGVRGEDPVLVLHRSRVCAVRRRGTWSTCGKCGWLRVRSSS